MHSTDVALFFQPAIDCIIKAVQEQRHAAHKTISVSVNNDKSPAFKAETKKIACHICGRFWGE